MDLYVIEGRRELRWDWSIEGRTQRGEDEPIEDQEEDEQPIWTEIPWLNAIVHRVYDKQVCAISSPLVALWTSMFDETQLLVLLNIGRSQWETAKEYFIFTAPRVVWRYIIFHESKNSPLSQ